MQQQHGLEQMACPLASAATAQAVLVIRTAGDVQRSDAQQPARSPDSLLVVIPA